MLKYLKYGNEDSDDMVEGVHTDMIGHWLYKKAKEEGQEDEIHLDLAMPAFECRPESDSLSCFRVTFTGDTARIFYKHLCKEAVELTPKKPRDAS